MLALWVFRWDANAWAARPQAAPAAEEGGRSNAGGGRRQYTGPHPDFWEVREKYLSQYAEAIDEAQFIATNDFTTPYAEDTLSGDRAGGREQLPLQWMDSLQGLRQALGEALQQVRFAADMQALESGMTQMRRLTLDIRNLQQQYYDRAISLLLLDAF